MQARLMAILTSPAGVANHRDAFAKVGDSITESASFLRDLGCQGPQDVAHYGAHASLMPVAAWFRRRTFTSGETDVWCGVANSFTRASVAAVSGMTSAFPFAPTEACAAPHATTMRCEYSRVHPSFALVMFGTNDVLSEVELPLDVALTRYRNNLQRIVDQSVELGVVPVLSTIPPLVRTSEVTQAMVDRVPAYNQVVISVASASAVPLWNYHRAMMEIGPAANYGISPDGIHPSVHDSGDGSNFTAEGLRHGYNVRNLTALQVLGALRTSLVME